MVEPGKQVLDAEWFGSVSLVNLGREIRQELQRSPDPGDLLIVLASMPDTIVYELMSDLKLDVDQLAKKIDGLRKTHRDRDPWFRVEEVRQRKELAKEAGRVELANRLRDEEGRLSRELRDNHEHALMELRIRLGRTEGRNPSRG